jgi:hypothetical protein
MQTILAKVEIQFDQFSDGDPELYTMETINKINEVLQREFNDISPLIFGNNIDSSDIEVSNTSIDEAYRGDCPVCGCGLTEIQEDSPSMRSCDACGSEWVRDCGDITLNSKEI